jgi:hypothetical protein
MTLQGVPNLFGIFEPEQSVFDDVRVLTWHYSRLQNYGIFKMESISRRLGVPLEKNSGFDFERRETIIVESKA